MEPEVKKEVDAALSLLESCSEEVPPQLLKALEKDGRSLARAYETAEELSQNSLQGLKDRRDSQKVNTLVNIFIRFPNNVNILPKKLRCEVNQCELRQIMQFCC